MSPGFRRTTSIRSMSPSWSASRCSKTGPRSCSGTAFATTDKRGTLQCGSPIMHVTGDRQAEHGLASIGWDDEGVAAQTWDLVRDGTLVGYQLDRRIAAATGAGRSNGCAFADSPL